MRKRAGELSRGRRSSPAGVCRTSVSRRLLVVTCVRDLPRALAQRPSVRACSRAAPQACHFPVVDVASVAPLKRAKPGAAPAADAELGEDRLHVVLHGVARDHEALGHRAVSSAAISAATTCRSRGLSVDKRPFRRQGHNRRVRPARWAWSIAQLLDPRHPLDVGGPLPADSADWRARGGHAQRRARPSQR